MRKFTPRARYYLLGGIWLFLQVTFLAGQSVVASDYRLQVKKLTPEEGLKGYVIKSICQDSRGMMWIATNNMVHRYDGHDLTYYPGLLDRWKIGRDMKMLRGPDGRVWMISGTVRNRAFSRSGMDLDWIKILQTDPDQPAVLFNFEQHAAPFGKEDIHQIDEGEGGSLKFFLRDGKVYRYDGQSFEKLYESKHGLPVSHYLKAYPGLYWVGEDKYLSLVNEEGRTLERDTLPCPVFFLYTSETGDAYINGGVIPIVKKEGDNQVDYHSRIYVKQMGKNPVSRLPDSPLSLDGFHLARPWGKNRIIFLRENNDELWVWEKGRGYILRLDWGTWWSPPIDNRGRLWIPFNKGLKIVSLERGQFHTFLKGEGISTRGITLLRDSLLWVNSYRGVFLLDKRGRIVQENDKEIGSLGVVKGKNGVISGTHGNQIKYYTESGKLEKLEWLGKKMEEREMGLPLIDKQGRLWIGGSGGLWVKESANGEWREVWDNEDNLEMRWLSEESEGIVFANNEGLWRLDPEQETVSAFSKALDGMDLIHLYRASTDSFWISTAAEGIAFWDRARDTLAFVEEPVGLKNNRVYAIYPDDKGCLWMPTDKGIYQYHPASNGFRVFGESDGIAHPEFNYFSHYQDPEGRLYFGGVNGITSFDPADFPTPSLDSTPFPLCVSNVQRFNLKAGFQDFTDEFYADGELKIGARGGMYSVKFSLPNNISTDYPPLYFYRLSSSSEWKKLEGNTLNLRNVPYGQYPVQVKAVGFDGLIYQSELEIPLHVVRPLYQNFWFWLIVGLLLGGFIWLVTRYQKRRHLQQQQRLEEEVRKRTRELERINNTKDRLFSVIGHELRTPIVNMQLLGKNLEYLLQQGKKEELRGIFSGMEQQSVHLRGLLDNLLLWGQNQTSRIPFRPQEVEVEKEIRDCGLVFDPVFKEKNIEISWRELPANTVWIDPYILCICFQNLLSNALKFTPAGGSIKISGEVDGDHYLLHVRDSGRGLSPNEWSRLFSDVPHSRNGTEGEKGAGIGLTIVKEMLGKYHGVVLLKNNPDKGVTATLKLQLFEEIPQRIREEGISESASFLSKKSVDSTKQKIQ